MLVKIIQQKVNQRYLEQKLRRIKKTEAPDCTFTNITYFHPNTKYEGGNVVHTGGFTGEIGYGSYIGPDSQLAQTSIGRYCSISGNVKLISGRHPTQKLVSTHPAFFSTQQQAGFTYVKENAFDEFRYADEDKRFKLIVGNDVWIGACVNILEGLRVGDGAIIGAGSVVTRDVPPYAVVVGSPARIIKYRFDESDVKFLMHFKWWDKDREWIRENAYLFCDIKEFRARFGMEES